MKLLDLLPDAWRPYAKTIVGGLSLLAMFLTDATPMLPEAWQPHVTTFLGFLTLALVYATPNDSAEVARAKRGGTEVDV